MADKKYVNPYQNINTAAELVSYISVHGLETNQDAICRAQDIVGHSCEEDLAALATDNKTREKFYWLLFKIWHWEEATRFWNKYSNPERPMMADVNKELADKNRECKALRVQVEDLKAKYEEALIRIDSEAAQTSWVMAEKDTVIKELDAARQEILVLKAKLYDMMMEKEGK